MCLRGVEWSLLSRNFYQVFHDIISIYAVLGLRIVLCVFRCLTLQANHRKYCDTKRNSSAAAKVHLAVILQMERGVLQKNRRCRFYFKVVGYM